MTFKMICLDADGVIFKGSDFWIDAHRAFGTLEQGRALTEQYLHTSYEKLVEEVVNKLWKGRDATPYLELVRNRQYMNGVKELFKVIKKKKWISAIVSGSGLQLVKRVQKDFRVDYVFANELIIKDGKVKDYNPEVQAGNQRKAEIINGLCKKLNISLEEVIFIGDSDYDLEAFKAVGKAIAFNSDSEELKKHAHIIVNSDDLRDVLPYLENL
jgi:phosphoserine phosphatase